MKARGKTKEILKKVEEIQSLIGQAQGSYSNDGGNRMVDRAEGVKPKLERAFELCLEIRGMYDPT